MKIKLASLISLFVLIGLYANAGNNCSYTIKTSNDTAADCADSIKLKSFLSKYYKVNSLNDNYFVNMSGFIESEDTFAVINNNHIYTSTDGGNTILSKTLQNSLTNVRFQKFGNTLVFTDQVSLVYKTSDWGKTWDSLTITGFQMITILDLKNFYGLTWDSFYSSDNSGKSWKKVASHPINSTNEIACFLNKSKGFLIEQYQIYMTTDGGISWKGTNSGGNISNGNFYFLDNNIGFLQSNHLYRTTDGGVSWTTVNSVYYPSAFAIDKDTLYYAETNGDISKSIDKGQTWTKIMSSVIPNYRYMLVKNGVFTFFDYNGNVLRPTKTVNYEWTYNNSVISTKPECKVKVMSDGAYIVKVSDSKGCSSADTVNVHSNFVVQSLNNQIIHCGDSVHLQAQTPQWKQAKVLDKTSIYEYTNLEYNIFSNDTTGYIFTNYDGLLKTIDGGNTWRYLSNDFLINYAKGGYFNSDTGWIVGGYGRIVKSIDGGKSWTSKQSNVTSTLYSISIPNETYSIIVGDSGTILKSVDKGETWIKKTSNTKKMLMTVVFVNSTTGFAVGDLGTILRTDDKGETWNSQLSNTTNDITSVFFTDSLHGIAVGTKGCIVITTDGGKNWLVKNSNTTKNLSAVWFADSLNGFATGFDILYTKDGGSTWIKDMNLGNDYLYSIAGTKKNSVVAVGTNGKMLKYNPSGNVHFSWHDSNNTIVSKNDNYNFKPQTNSVIYVETTNEKGCVARTQDTVSIRGLQYTIETPKETTCGDGMQLSLTNLTYLKTFKSGITSVNFTDSKNGLIVSQYDSLFHTVDGGIHWKAFNLPKDSTYNTSLNNNIAFFVDDTTGFVSVKSFLNNAPILFKTQNNGETWTKVDTTFESIDYSITPEKIYFLSNNAVRTSIDNGKTWITITIPSTNQLLKINAYNADTCVVLDTYNNCYITLDGCKTWNKVSINSQFSSYANWIKIIDKNTIYAANNDQLARSFDFGKTWDVITCVSYSTYYISFADRDNGFCINDNILYTTHDKGNSWIPIKKIKSIYSWVPGPIYAIDKNTVYFRNCIDFYSINLNLYKNFSWTSIADGILGSSPNCISYPKNSSKVIVEASINDYCTLKDTVAIKVNPLIVDLGKDKVAYPQREIVLQAYAGNNNKSERKQNNTIGYFSNNVVAFANESTGLSYDNFNGLSLTTDSGKTWKSLNIGWVTKVQFLNNDLGIVLANSQLYKIFNSGSTWLQFNFTYSNIHDFTVTQDGTLFVVSDQGIIYKSEDVGKSLTRADSSKYLYNFVKIQFNSVDTGYVLGSDSGVVVTTDKGKTWQKETQFPKYIKNFYLFDKLHAIATSSLNSNAWYTSNDGYKTWIYHQSSEFYGLKNFQFNNNICYADDDLNKSYISKDYGVSWQSINAKSITVMNNNIFYYSKEFTESLYVAKEDIPAKYNWSSTIKGLNNSNLSINSLKPENSGYVYVTATTNNGCVGKGAVYVAVIDSKKIDNIDSIRVNPKSVTLNRKKQVDTLHVSVFPPKNLVSSNLYWAYTNKDVFTVQNDSIIRPLSIGKAFAYVYNDQGVISNYVDVSVGCDILSSLNITSELYGFSGENQNISIYTNFSNILQCIKWQSTDTNVAKVDSLGNVKYIKDGKALIIASTTDKSLKDTCVVYVGCNVTTLSIPQELTVYKNQNTSLWVNSNQVNVNACILWTSQNTLIATVNNYGTIVGFEVGTTVITASTKDNSLSSSCIVKVVDISNNSSNINSENISIYPNPSNDFVIIKTEDNRLCKAILYNTKGEIINEYALNSKEIQINTKGLPSGLYFINIKNDSETKTFQLSVQH